MANSIAVIEQLSKADAKPTFHVKRRDAILFISTGQAVWVIPEQLIRKTHKFGRLTSDARIQEQSAKSIPWQPRQSGYAGPLVMQMVTS
jgi:hypothetical protein